MKLAKIGIVGFITFLLAFSVAYYEKTKKPFYQPDPLPSRQVQRLTDEIHVDYARIKATIPGIKVTSGYLNITNKGTETVRFTEVETEAAKHTEFHRMFLRDSRMAMRKADVIEVKPNETFKLEPSGHHLMLMGLTQRFKAGETIKVTLIRDNGERYTLDFPVMANKAK
ncbi:copper chaperone PCu(A)C [Vibrio sp. S9_S30]|uniref:copper chaperone PCu(A)C n=1 Tax=Vibrio sp. S9_S30 TaxID=2720226 RepID=UPI0016818042|nr:copper chaperone PCu(A)C [Vibrio sp. S9_S30]MBD1556470.1 copper chaperone PCu(A)C [Vibrio sp. S9_S30]